MPLTCSDCPKICCSVIIPPVGVFVEKGCSIHLLINILLTLLGYIPGLIHACFIIVKY
uniref:YkgJ family cysteine cluster protein n=1 Tax=Parascaris univalens TaxID=6257 RepID=A0A915CL52_PARUN